MNPTTFANTTIARSQARATAGRVAWLITRRGIRVSTGVTGRSGTGLGTRAGPGALTRERPAHHRTAWMTAHIINDVPDGYRMFDRRVVEPSGGSVIDAMQSDPARSVSPPSAGPSVFATRDG